MAAMLLLQCNRKRPLFAPVAFHATARPPFALAIICLLPTSGTATNNVCTHGLGEGRHKGDRQQEEPMRTIYSRLLPIIAALGASGAMFSMALA
jgi:hypothetical protein